MAAEMLLLNPAPRRRKAKKSTKRRTVRRNPTAARAPRRVARRVARRTARRSNPIMIAAPRRVRRRRNPLPRAVRRYVSRRRQRNPIAIGSMTRSTIAMIKSALIGAGGAIAMDALWGQASQWLPASLKRTPGQPGVGDAVKLLATVLVGRVLAKPTRGMSMKAAEGAVTVQVHELLAGFVPSSIPMGYAVPGRVMPGSARVGPNRAMLSRYVTPGVTPMLSRYTQPGVSPLLNGRDATMAREGFNVR